mmetsp:Transcript_25451/g.83750  ORF Transcript_25451/g.83750 Transcript_25451/m.83750 type:complete len:301 (+) Transcript_25451:1-903(+)
MGDAFSEREMESPFKPTVLEGEVALITGGASGIGLGITRELAKHGAAVVVMGRRGDVVQSCVAELTAEGLKAAGVPGDVRSPADAEKAVNTCIEKFGKLSILVNSAAGNFLSKAENLSTNAFKTVSDIDAVGTFNMSRASFAQLRSNRGSIINITATLQYGATWYVMHASAAKAAVDSVTRSLALEWGMYGIRVNGIAPGPIRGTAGMTKLAPGLEEEMEKRVSQEIPLGRMGTVTDIAYAAVYLSSSAGAYVSGDTLVVDGAAWMYKKPIMPPEMVAAASRGIEKKSRAVGLPDPKSKL